MILSEEYIKKRYRGLPLANLERINLWNGNFYNIDILEQCTKAEIISLTQNNISQLCAFKKLKKLKELYLRRNIISDFDQLKNLGDLPELRILWLGENPIEKEPNYREKVISILPQLIKLDQVNITSQERQFAISSQQIGAIQLDKSPEEMAGNWGVKKAADVIEFAQGSVSNDSDLKFQSQMEEEEELLKLTKESEKSNQKDVQFQMSVKPVKLDQQSKWNKLAKQSSQQDIQDKNEGQQQKQQRKQEKLQSGDSDQDLLRKVDKTVHSGELPFDQQLNTVKDNELLKPKKVQPSRRSANRVVQKPNGSASERQRGSKENEKELKAALLLLECLYTEDELMVVIQEIERLQQV